MRVAATQLLFVMSALNRLMAAVTHAPLRDKCSNAEMVALALSTAQAGVRREDGEGPP